MAEESASKSAKIHTKISNKMREDNENGARLGIIEDLFNDFYLRRHRVYWVNFVRGLFFGFGSVLGGTILVAIAIWILSQLVHFPGIGEFFQAITNSLKHKA